MKARINLIGEIPGKGSTVELDGVDFARAIRALTIQSDARYGTTLMLEMSLLSETSLNGEVELRLTREVEEALLALGWTPPPPTPALAADPQPPEAG